MFLIPAYQAQGSRVEVLCLSVNAFISVAVYILALLLDLLSDAHLNFLGFPKVLEGSISGQACPDH